MVAACGRVGFDATPGGDDVPDGRVAFDYPTHNIEAIGGLTMIDLVPGRVVGDALVFEVSPALPLGLAIASDTGAITGIPTEDVDNALYVVTASNGVGSASVELSATVMFGYRVDTFLDGSDDDSGADPTCFSSLAGGCSLRAAIETTNGKQGKQLVLLPTGTVLVDSQLPEILDEVELAGVGGSVVQAVTPHTYRAFKILQAIGRLWLKSVTFESFGGVDGGVLEQQAGALAADECTFRANHGASRGGVLNITGGTATFTDCAFLANRAVGGNQWGGAINAESTGTQVVVERSYAAQNETGWGSFAHITAGSTLALLNSTLTANVSSISGTLASPGGHYTIANSTIAYNTNTAPDPSQQVASAGIYLYSTPAEYAVTNSIIAFNTMFDGAETNCTRRDSNTMLTSGGGNVLGDAASTCATFFTERGDRLATDPGLEALGDHGGPTPTFPLSPTKIARGAGQGPCPALDQRSIRRPASACDAGAFEAD